MASRSQPRLACSEFGVNELKGSMPWLILIVSLSAACAYEPYGLTRKTIDVAHAPRRTVIVRQDDTPRGLALSWRVADGAQDAAYEADAGRSAMEEIWLLPIQSDFQLCSHARIAAYASPGDSIILTLGEDQPLAPDEFASFYANFDDEGPCEFALLHRDMGSRGAFLQLYGPEGLVGEQQVTPDSYPAAWIFVPVVAILETGLLALGALGMAMG